MSTSAIVDAFSQLGHAQQLQLLADMWDRVAEKNAPKITAAQKKEISRRKKQYLAGKSKAVPWSQVKERLLKGDAR
jgi:putative addiction module component (TIGR02574 family)